MLYTQHFWSWPYSCLQVAGYHHTDICYYIFISNISGMAGIDPRTFLILGANGLVVRCEGKPRGPQTCSIMNWKVYLKYITPYDGCGVVHSFQGDLARLSYTNIHRQYRVLSSVWLCTQNNIALAQGSFMQFNYCSPYTIYEIRFWVEVFWVVVLYSVVAEYQHFRGSGLPPASGWSKM